MTASSNWIHEKNPGPSINDKLVNLLKLGDSLVLVQKHELERIKKYRHKDRYAEYINQLYTHYIILSLPKTYLT